MAFSTSTAALALLGLRLKGFAPAAQVAALVGLDEAVVELELKKAAASEQAVYRDGRRTGWALKPAGRSEVERLLGEELDQHSIRPTVQSAYNAFLKLNGQMLRVCTAWQVKDADAQVLNDHTDSAYDAEVIADLAALDDAVQPICETLSEQLERFSIYSPRFSSSLDKTKAGEHEWFTAPLKESYHTVWFELHEDLLATLGIDRSSEESH